MSNNYTVYKHTSPSNKVYIGITYQEPERRWRSGNGYKYNKYFTNAIQKYGWDNFQHEILYTGLTKEEAEQKEIELIATYNSTNPSKGYNLDYGGNSIGKHTEESKRKMSESKLGMCTGENNPFYGKTHTDKVKIIISKKAKVRLSKKENHPFYNKHMSNETKRILSEINKGRHISEETKEKIRIANTGDKNGMFGKTHSEEVRQMLSDIKKIPVCQYSLNGDFVKEWNSATDVESELGIYHNHITQCCKGRQKTAGGFIWKYKGDNLDLNNLSWYNSGHNKSICQYSKDGMFIKKFSSIKEANIETEIDNSAIAKCCKGKSKTAGGYVWKYSD